MWGCVTNFKDWIFTIYSMRSEIYQDIGLESKEPVFEYTKTMTIFEIKDDEIVWRDNEFNMVMKILKDLNILFTSMQHL